MNGRTSARKGAALLLAALLGLLCACGRKAAQTDVDLPALGRALADSGAFSDAMRQPDQTIACRVYGFEEDAAESFVFYTGAGATAEEIFLVKAAAGSAAALREACEKRTENQKKAFEGYAPAEIQKLDDAVLETVGDYVLFVVAADADAARTVVDSYTGA